MKTVFLVLLVSVIPLNIVQAGELSLLAKQSPDRLVTGNLRVDLFGQTELASVPNVTPDEGLTMRHHRSPYIAGGLSLVVPGAGQFYTEHYWEAAAFLAADVAAWLLASHYDKKGDKQTDFFQNYADGHWSVVDYAKYAADNYAPGQTFSWEQSTDPNLPPWQRVNWSELNRMERYIGSTSAGQYYSHTLPVHGDQQYYELIGKYQQFNQGWDDRPPIFNYYDPVTAHFSYYAIERGKANNYYKNASTWVTVAIVNHVVNAFYAALSAGWYNSAHAELGLQSVPSDKGFTNVPVMKVRLEF